MSKGKKTGGKDWGENNKPPKSKGRPPITGEAKEMQQLTRAEFIKRVNKYFYMSKAQIKEGLTKDDIEVLDLFIRNSIVKGIEKGDYGVLDRMLDRVIGKVTVNMDLSGSIDANVNNNTTITVSDKALEALGNAIARAASENS